MDLRAPTGFAQFEVEWTVPDGAHVQEGATLAWLTPAGHCALLALLAPCPGVVSRRSSLLPVALPGELLAVVGGGDAELRSDERRLLGERRLAVERELRALEARSLAHPAAATLLQADVRRLRDWLALAPP